MDVSSPSYMLGSWVLWGALILPTMYLDVQSDPTTTDVEMWKRIAVVFGQVIVAGGAFAAAPGARALLMNPIPPMVMGTMLYVLKYTEKSKPFDNKKLVKWVAVTSLIATIGIPQLIAGVKRGNFTGGEFSGLKPGTMGYTVASFFAWAFIILPMIKSRFETTLTEKQQQRLERKKNQIEKNRLINVDAEAEVGELQNTLTKTFGKDDMGLFSFLPIILKLLVLVAVASIPMVQSYISDPLSPVIAIVAYVVLRTAGLVTDVEAAVIAAVALIPQLQTLIRNPIPPVIMIVMYLLMKNLGVGEEQIVGNTGTISLVLTVAFQVVQEFIPTILGYKGVTLTTGTSFYNNISLFAWLVISIPGIYFFLRGRNNVENDEITQLPYNTSAEGFENIEDWKKDMISLSQLVALYGLAVGVQSFRGLFMNPVPPMAILGLLAFTMWVQKNNPQKNYPNNEGLVGIISAFALGTNVTLAGPVITKLFKNIGGALPVAASEPMKMPSGVEEMEMPSGVEE